MRNRREFLLQSTYDINLEQPGKIVLASPVGNLCVEAHLRDFIEHGFEVAMVGDATAGARNEEGDGYQAALINWRFIAPAMWTTSDAVRFIEALAVGARPGVAA
jgi:nicotinamidase-related amidase